MLSAHFKRGFVPAGGATYLLPKIIGLGKTQDLFFGERTINASEMKEMGILHRVVKDEEMLKECMKEARRLERGPLDAIGETKMLLNSQELKMMKEHLVLERESNRESGNTGDAVEGVENDKITLKNIGWGAAYNITYGKQIVEIVESEEMIVLDIEYETDNSMIDMITYNRMNITGEEESMTEIAISIREETGHIEQQKWIPYPNIMLIILTVVMSIKLRSRND